MKKNILQSIVAIIALLFAVATPALAVQDEASVEALTNDAVVEAVVEGAETESEDLATDPLETVAIEPLVVTTTDEDTYGDVSGDAPIGGMHFAADDEVVIGTTDGDVFTAGAAIIVNGQINGDLFAAGSSITVGEEVYGDVRVAGSSITIAAPIHGNLFAAGSTVTVQPGVTIDGHVTLYGAQVIMNGTVEESASIGAGQAIINGEVKNGLLVESDSATLSETAAVAGEATITTYGEEAYIHGSAVVPEDISLLQEERTEHQSEWSFDTEFLAIPAFAGLLASFVTFFLVGLVLILAEPKWMRNVAKTAQDELGKSWLYGAVFLFATPVVLALISATIIGIPFAILAFGAYALVLLFARIPVALWLGEKIWKYGDNNPTHSDTIVRFLLGYVILAILTAIPVLGWLLGLLVGIWGIGAVITEYTLRHKSKK